MKNCCERCVIDREPGFPGVCGNKNCPCHSVPQDTEKVVVEEHYKDGELVGLKANGVVLMEDGYDAQDTDTGWEARFKDAFDSGELNWNEQKGQPISFERMKTFIRKEKMLSRQVVVEFLLQKAWVHACNCGTPDKEKCKGYLIKDQEVWEQARNLETD